MLRAMNVPEDFARGTLRLSTGIHTSHPEIEASVDIVCSAIDAAYQTLDEEKKKATK